MTSEELKTQVDAQITNKTAAKSVTPAIVGANMKAVVDYAVQQVLTKVVKTTITEAQVLLLYTAPVTILDSSEAGKVKYPTNIYIVRKAGTGYTLAAAYFSVTNDFDTTQSSNINPNPLTSGQIGYMQSAINVVQSWSGGTKNSIYKLGAGTGDPIGGTGDLDVYVTYVEITQ